MMLVRSRQHLLDVSSNQGVSVAEALSLAPDDDSRTADPAFAAEQVLTDLRGRWKQLSLQDKRMLVQANMRIVIHPGRGTKRSRYEAVQISTATGTGIRLAL